MKNKTMECVIAALTCISLLIIISGIILPMIISSDQLPLIGIIFLVTAVIFTLICIILVVNKKYLKIFDK